MRTDEGVLIFEGLPHKEKAVRLTLGVKALELGFRFEKCNHAEQHRMDNHVALA